MKELDYTKEFGERLAQKRDRTGFPRDIIFEITHRCNLRCRHCYVVPPRDEGRGMRDEGRRELNTKDVFNIFDQLVDAGCLHVTLTGGEPLLRKDILSLIDYARRIGLFIHLFTNASLITPEIADRLKELQLISLEISFHSLKRERFDWFTQVEGSFDRVMEAIRLLRKRRQKLCLKINITKANIDEIEDLKRFVKDLEATPEWATALMLRSDGCKDNLFLRLEPEEMFRVRDMLYPEPVDEGEPSLSGAKEDEGSGRDWVRGKLFQCGVGKKGLAINPYGELKPCLEFPFSCYNLLEGNLKEGWKRIKDYVESFKPSPEYKCIDCNLKNSCSSCPAKAWLECGDVNGCPEYYRRLAELTAK